MASLLNTIQALDLRKKIVLGVAVLLTVAMILFIARSASQPNMALLYGGLDAKAAGEVVAAVDQLGVATEVRGDAIYVPISERDRVRLALAKEGLPAQGQAGYELLDGLSGFGTTSEMFEAAYWRAKEGELARTIAAVPGVRAARVHIGASARRPFARSADKSTAAVTVTTQGGPLSNASALSIRFLVALAVADLDPAQVAVIDARHGVVLRPGEDRASPFADENADRRAQRLKEELEQLLAVRVGEGNVRISVAVETTRESETVSERIIDPESRVTMNSETEEVTEQSQGGNGAVTVASNLPDGDVANANDNRSNREQTRENVTYNYSRTERNRIIEAGSIKRLGVAVLVDEVEATNADGETVRQPRSAEELAAIEDLVKSAIAFDAERGDVVTVESMPFAEAPALGSEAEIGLIEQVVASNAVSLIQGLILAIAAVALGYFVVRPILMSAAASAETEEEKALAQDEAALSDGEAEAGAVLLEDGTVAAPAIAGGAPGAAALPNSADPLALAPPGPGDAEEDLPASGQSTVDVLREAVGERTDESVALLKRWLHAPAEAADESRAS